MTERARISRVPRLGALDRWRQEIRAGKRRNDFKSFDNLAAAACSEITALEYEAEGNIERATYYMDLGLIRLHGIDGRPDDGTPTNPGPGRRFLSELRKAVA